VPAVGTGCWWGPSPAHLPGPGRQPLFSDISSTRKARPLLLIDPRAPKRRPFLKKSAAGVCPGYRRPPPKAAGQSVSPGKGWSQHAQHFPWGGAGFLLFVPRFVPRTMTTAPLRRLR